MEIPAILLPSGDDFDAFAHDLRAALNTDEDTTFPELIRWGYTLARKPAAETVAG